MVLNIFLSGHPSLLLVYVCNVPYAIAYSVQPRDQTSVFASIIQSDCTSNNSGALKNTKQKYAYCNTGGNIFPECFQESFNKEN